LLSALTRADRACASETGRPGYRERVAGRLKNCRYCRMMLALMTVAFAATTYDAINR
jgi:hypothetical protein